MARRSSRAVSSCPGDPPASASPTPTAGAAPMSSMISTRGWPSGALPWRPSSSAATAPPRARPSSRRGGFMAPGARTEGLGHGPLDGRDHGPRDGRAAARLAGRHRHLALCDAEEDPGRLPALPGDPARALRPLRGAGLRHRRRAPLGPAHRAAPSRRHPLRARRDRALRPCHGHPRGSAAPRRALARPEGGSPARDHQARAALRPHPERAHPRRQAMKAHVLIETAAGKTKGVKKSLTKIKSGRATVNALDAVTGPYDFIAVVEGQSLDAIGNLVTDSIGVIDGVTRTTTCVAVSVG